MNKNVSFDDIVEHLSNGHLWDFKGGIHPSENKAQSNTSGIDQLPIPATLYVPVNQHLGANGELAVSVGDKVAKGQALTKSNSANTLPVHAPTSGTVEAIETHPSAHPSGIPELSIKIATDGQDQAVPSMAINDFLNADKQTLINAICQAGISGMGGAGFPSHIKSDVNKEVEFLIINGVECEPYITADDRLMREHAWQIRQGIDIIKTIVCPKQIVIAIEDNKPEALAAMKVACNQHSDYKVVAIPTKYPSGGEKQLIQVLTSREVPNAGLPIDVGCLMFNVGTCYAIADAIIEGKPLTQRVVTVTGGAIGKPKNVWAMLGTPVKHLLEYCEFDHSKQQHARVIMGGSMMGFTLSSAQAPIIKTSNCIIAPTTDELPNLGTERACIRCSACADACPVQLLPQQLYWYSKAKEYQTAQGYDLFDCIECGACAYVCPSEIPLVHYYRQAKSEIRQHQDEKQQADKAKLRFEARKQRLEKEKQAREEKHRLASEARKQKMQQSGVSAKDKIAAALARAKAKKLANQQQIKTPEPDVKPTTDDKDDAK